MENRVQKAINNLIETSGVDKYDSVSYEHYLNSLTKISAAYMTEREELRIALSNLPSTVSKETLLELFL